MEHLEATINYLLKNRIKTREGLAKTKREIAKKYKIACPDNISLLKTYHKLLKKKKIKKSALLEYLLITRPVRSLSGIVNISVLTKPYPCPGKCLFCPQEKGLPKSYLSGEPAVERAKRLKFSPYWQVKKRIEMLEAEGHPTDKIELRIVGGTWSYYPKKYQEWFVKECFRAANKSSKLKDRIPLQRNEGEEENKILFARLQRNEGEEENKILFAPQNSRRQLKTKSLKKEQKRNEKTKHRIVGLSIETRPDFINEQEIKRLRELGATMAELGVQSIYDDVLKLNLRGHKVKETILATKLLKEAGFKVLYQMMPNLPGSNLKKDKEMFVQLFKNPDFQPDMLKIYPCALLKEAPLYKLWKRKKYKPYSEKELISLIKSIKKIIPPYVRIQRISRDIPSGLIVAGPAKISNLRQILKDDMKKKGWLCQCIRCREVKESHSLKEKVFLFRQDYRASEGKEIFLSFENKKRTKLYSLLRLRLTSENKAIIREIHTFGPTLPIKCTGATRAFSPQHRGMGKKLIKEAEKITKKEFKLKTIKVIASLGARDYFRKIGYKLRNTYVAKSI